ncbi:antA/AntB antirepressor family protein [Pasteurella multocida]|uniref:antA/AntB antirepressor family protein n=1 Tax=Pasteurella multocida TaxID=747 RepID=UPI001E35D9CB|nr:antA/AntB antirepressor family protein [Pasteurella multocida]MDA5620632.1 antA/AntB antirepressor family protein [Pasteurella multocida subsp. multocida]
MTNSNLIPVFNGTIQNTQIQLCNARELHAFVESKREYATWIKDRITDYGFIENEDYIIVTERTNGRPRKEYHITLDMGKELGMVERNEKGRQIRKHFIEIEKRAKQPQQLALPEPKPRGILLDEEAFYVVAKAIAKLNESTFEWEKMMDLFSELESHRNYKTAFNLGVASYNLAQSSEKVIMKNLAQMKNKVWKKEIEDFIFSNPHLQNHTENKLVHYLR